MTWKQLCADKSLADLPYRIELNRQGQIIMSPIRRSHTIFQGRIERHLNALLTGGEASPECAVDTADGTKSPDVVWASTAHIKKYFDVFSCPEAPEICVEVLSSSNTKEEMAVKRNLYFERGALEVWLCDRKGRMTFFNRSGQIPNSMLCPAFPASVGD